MDNCKFHVLLIGSSFDQILKRLSNFHFTYQVIDCLYTLYEYGFYSNAISSTGEVFNQLDRAVHHYLCSNQKLASTQTIGSPFLERVRKVQNSKYEHDLLKMIDCLIDGYGFVNSDHVNFSLKSF